MIIFILSKQVLVIQSVIGLPYHRLNSHSYCGMQV